MLLSLRRILLSLTCATFLSAGAYASDQNKQSLLNRGIDISAGSLVQHAGQGDWITVQSLLRAGVLIDEPEPLRQQTALHAAAAQGHDRLLRELIQLKARPDMQDDCGNTALINAAYQGRLSTLIALLQTGEVRVNHGARCGMTPLIAAIYAGDLPSIRALLDAQANPRQASLQGVTPLQAAQLKKRSDIQALLEAAAK